TLPARIALKAAVARARRRIITRACADRVKYADERRSDVHREVRVGLGEGRARGSVAARHRPDIHEGERKPDCPRTATFGERERGGLLDAKELRPVSCE